MIEAVASARMVTLRACRRPMEGHPQAWDVGPSIVLDSPSEHCEIVTFSGGVFSKRAWPSLLEDACGVLLVLDPQSTRDQANREAMEVLTPRAQNLIGCVVLTKQDLVAAGIPSVPAERLLEGTPFRAWPLFRTRHDQPATQLKPIEWVLARLGIAGCNPKWDGQSASER